MKSAVIGSVFGLVLLFLSLAIGGAGHGILIPLVISVAPIPVVLFPYLAYRLILVTILLPSFVWGTVATLAHARRRWLFPVVMGFHYISAAIYSAMAWRDDVNDPSTNFADIVHFEAPYLAAFALIYAGGQLWLWRSFARQTA